MDESFASAAQKDFDNPFCSFTSTELLCWYCARMRDREAMPDSVQARVRHGKGDEKAPEQHQVHEHERQVSVPSPIRCV